MKQKAKCENKEEARKGSALIFATIILFSLLAITVTLSAITVQDMKMSQKTKSSTGAFFNADSGVEWALNKIANTDQDTLISHSTKGFSLDTAGATVCPGGFGCNVYLLKSDGTVIKPADSLKFADIKAVRAVGREGNDTQRAIEAAVASGGGGCYVSYKNDATDAACVTGFKNKGSAGHWGYVRDMGAGIYGLAIVPPGGTSPFGLSFDEGQAYVCCQ